MRPLVEAILTQQLTAYFEDLKHQDLAQQIIEKAVRDVYKRQTKDWECNCGKYKRIKFKDKNKICDKCGVQVLSLIHI